MPENVHHFFQQIRTLIGQLSKQQKLSMAGLAIAVLVPLGWVVVSNSGEELVPLQWGARFDRDALHQAEQALIDQGLTDFKTVGETILVEKEKVEAYNAALASGGIWSAQAVDEWQKMFEDINIFTPREQFKEMRNAHLRREIRRVISAIDSVQDADVIWAESSSLSRWNRTSVTCSVAITTRAKQQLTPGLIESLQTTVASMIPNLEPAGVVIFDRRTGQSWSGGEASVTQLRSLAKRQSMIDGLQNTIREALTFVPDAIVSANIEFEPASDTATPAIPDSAAPKSLHLTVSIPDDFLAQVAVAKHGQNQNADKAADSTNNAHAEIRQAELAKIETICARLLPAGFGADDVTVTTFTRLNQNRDTHNAASDSTTWSLSWLIGLVVCGVTGFCWVKRRRSLPANLSETQTIDLPNPAQTDDSEKRESLNAPFESLGIPVSDSASLLNPLELVRVESESVAADVLAQRKPPFDFLRRMTPDDIYFLLADENPQTIAIVLSHVSTQMATDVLSSFPESQQLDIVRRIANSAGTNCEFLDELAESLQEKSQTARRRNDARKDSTQGVRDSSQAGAWRISSIEQLADLESTVLATLIQKVPRQIIAIAISGLTLEKRSQILLHLPHHVSKEIREHVASQGAMTRADIGEAQQDVLNRIGVSVISPSSKNRSSREFVA